MNADTAVISLATIALLPLAFTAIVLLSKQPSFGVLGIAIVILSQWDFPNQKPIFTVAASNVYLPDLICLALFMAGVLNVKVVARQLRFTWTIWALIGFLAIASLSRGVTEFGLGPAVNESRLILLPLLALFWAFSIDWQSDNGRSAVFGGVRVISWLLVALSLYHGARYGIGTANSAFVMIDGVPQSTRVLTQLQSLAVGTGLLVCLEKWQSGQWRRAWIDATCFAIVVLVSQQRTVWVATLVGVVLLVIRGTVKTRVMTVALFVAAIIAIVFIASTSWGGALLSDVGDSATDQGTYEGRLASWPQLIAQALQSGEFSIVFGQPFGAGFVRVEPNGAIAIWSPHNFYLLIFLRLGVLGLALYLTVLISAFVVGMRRNTSPLALSLFLQVSIFCWSYGLSWVSVVPFAWAIASRQETRHAPRLPEMTLAGRMKPLG